MESIKKGNIYDFTKKLQQTSKTAFIKIIKITKNWKVIGYFRNLKEMEEAVEDSCTLGDINKVWLVRNKKMIYRNGEELSKMNQQKEKTNKFKKKATVTEKEISSRPASELKTPMTPPERIYRELGNFTSRKESLLYPSKAEMSSRRNRQTPDEETVVEMIKNWRVGEDTLDHNDNSIKQGQQIPLKKDNITTDEVVDVINTYRDNKIKYYRHVPSPSMTEFARGRVTAKLKEVKEIFDRTSNMMEWERINKLVLADEKKPDVLETNNFFHTSDRIISLAEQSRIFQEYTTLNDDFADRLRDTNRYQDEKKSGEKRPILESPSKSPRTPDVKTSEDDDDYLGVLKSFMDALPSEGSGDEENKMDEPLTKQGKKKKKRGGKNKKR
ncbi:hypothetical protein RhiirC2_822858 [Rhizophagus irregularis]|uniref:Uncharacterized protein n=1 Tax=Rhizophagus irregularis TaxID=588596 RepID=A0A2N1MAA6_9GLOM|nr:hypothetical protein RhiirC2_822858 [Rhizophagus irregularis]